MNKILAVATKYIGETEKPKNSGFTKPEFEKRMVAVGWGRAMAWCAFFVELVCREAMPEQDAELAKLFSGSALTTYNNFEKIGKTSQTPKIGDLVVWRYGKTWQGHIGIVTEVYGTDMITTIEGNTNDMGGREGYIVAKKMRKLNQRFLEKGLNIEGFITV
ncbi:CHAP domain-containing protein [Emticicia sp.]|uniref:CHAP domain-containing protein n=1 Tax=Emticicia sp. TaxID=1930953 RepID=UPI003750B545